MILFEITGKIRFVLILFFLNIGDSSMAGRKTKSFQSE